MKLLLPTLGLLLASHFSYAQTEHYENAKEHSRHGDLDKAIAELDKIPESDKSYKKGVHFKVDILNDGKHYVDLVEALHAQEKIIDQNSMAFAINRKKLGQSYFHLGQFKESVSSFEASKKIHTSDALELDLAEAYIAAKMYDKAKNITSSKTSKGSQGQLLNAIATYFSGDYKSVKEALEAYNEAPQETDYRGGLYLALSNQKLKKKKEICPALEIAQNAAEKRNILREAAAWPHEQLAYKTYITNEVNQIYNLQDKSCK